MKADLLKGHVDLVLLSCLHEGPAHGYLLVKRLRERSAGEVELLEGTVYPALHRLEAGGLVASTWSTASGRRRRVYRITKNGNRALGARTDDWRALTRVVDSILAAPA